MRDPQEVVFLVEDLRETSKAKVLGHAVFTEADTLEELRECIRDALHCHFDGEGRPAVIRWGKPCGG